jgi:iron complex outermembrane receptor protein
VVAQATVAATHSETQQIFETMSDQQGRYRFDSVPPGSYRVEASAANFRRVVQTVTLAGGQSAELDFVLPLRPIAETVTVSEIPEEVAALFESIPGGVALIGGSEIQQSRAATLKDALAFTPGVLAQSRFGADESQLSIRGSGLRNNFHARGLNLLVNGMPYQDADGFSDFESLELMATDRVEVWKGANALRFGGNTMGGAINFVTRTGATSPPVELRVVGGAYGYYKAQLASGGVAGPLSYYASFTASEMDGYRAHSQQGRHRLFANIGWRVNPRTNVGVDIIYANVAEKLPGALTLAEFLTNPRQADSTNASGDWGRFYNYVRLGMRVQHEFSRVHTLSFNIHGQYRNMDHPIFQILDQDSRNFGGEIHYAFHGTLAGRRNQFVVGFAPQHGTTGERRFVNLGAGQPVSQRGPLTALFGTEATNYGLYFENQFDVTSAFTFVAGGRADWAQREFKDRFLSDGDRSDRRTFSAFSPKLGFVWRMTESAQLFGNISRSYEPPLLLELTSFGAPGFLPLAAQDTWQYEIGTRGRLSSWLAWDAAFFDAEIENEIINENVQPFPGAPFTIPSFRNAPDTRHLGIELSTGARLAEGLASSGDRLTWRLAYTWSRFRFVNDPVFGNNHLPGAPQHLLRSELRYSHPRGFWVAPNLDWSPARYFVNSANTAVNTSYVVLNLKAGYDWTTGRDMFASFYFEAANLTDRNYSGSVQVDNALGRFFEPANGRSVYAGVNWRFGR